MIRSLRPEPVLKPGVECFFSMKNFIIHFEDGSEDDTELLVEKISVSTGRATIVCRAVSPVYDIRKFKLKACPVEVREGRILIRELGEDVWYSHPIADGTIHTQDDNSILLEIYYDD